MALDEDERFDALMEMRRDRSADQLGDLQQLPFPPVHVVRVADLR